MSDPEATGLPLESQLAYEAGQAANTEPPERRSVDACPFSEGTEERAQWLRGFGEALQAAPDTTQLTQEIASAVDTNDSAGG